MRIIFGLNQVILRRHLVLVQDEGAAKDGEKNVHGLHSMLVIRCYCHIFTYVKFNHLTHELDIKHEKTLKGNEI